MLHGFRKKCALRNIAVPGAFPWVYTITNTWESFGWGSILFLSTIPSIDPGLYETAKIDGANRFQCMLYVTLPFMSNLIMIQMIFSIGGLLSSNTKMIPFLYNQATYRTADVIGAMCTVTDCSEAGSAMKRRLIYSFQAST